MEIVRYRTNNKRVCLIIFVNQTIDRALSIMDYDYFHSENETICSNHGLEILKQLIKNLYLQFL